MWLFDLLYVYCEKSGDKGAEKVKAIWRHQFGDWRHKETAGCKVVVLLNREGRDRKTGSGEGVGMEVFRDSLWTDSDMGTHNQSP